jgi:hypothetical protein
MQLDAAAQRAVRTPSGRRGLVAAIHDSALATNETAWIEWKNGANLLDDVDLVKHLVRHILGFANRDPDQAARVSDGCAYVLIGVEPGNLAGTAPVDIATLEQRIASYTGPGGPEWDASYVEYDSKPVLVVTVEAPRWGDTIFALAKNVGPYENGRIFVRRPGRTTPAKAEDLKRLVERARLTRRTPQLEVAWLTDPPAMPALEILEADTKKVAGPRARTTHRPPSQAAGHTADALGFLHRTVGPSLTRRIQATGRCISSQG